MDYPVGFLLAVFCYLVILVASFFLRKIIGRDIED
jgi:hypothetical protein